MGDGSATIIGVMDHEVEPGCCPSPGDDRRAFLKFNAKDEGTERISPCTLAPVAERLPSVRATRGRLIRDVAAFFREHRDCGELDAAVVGDDRVCVTCTCGARIDRTLTD